MTDLKPFFPSDPDVLAVFHEELARAALVDSGPAFWPRFAGHYQGLARLPRRLRRLKYLGVFLLALAMLGGGSRAQAIDSDDLAIAVTASSDPVVPGGLLLYQLTATNRGTIPTSGGVTMTAFVPGDTSGAGVTDGGDCPGGVCNTGEAVTWSLSDLPAGASRTVGLSVEVFRASSAPPDGALIPQQAAVTSEGFSAFAEHTVIVKRTPLLSLNMRAGQDPIEPGAALSYTLVFGNPGELAASGVTLRALVPVGTSFQSADGGGTQSGGVVSWPLGTVGAGKSGERRFTVIVDAPVAAGNILLSDAEIFDSAAPSNIARSATATAVNGNPRLALSLTAGADPVASGGVVLYQLTATNRGTIPTSGGVTMTAFVPGDTSGAGVTDGGDCPGGVCNTGEAVTWSLSDLPAGASRTVGLSVRVFGSSSAPPDGALIPQQAAVTSEGGSASAAAVSRVCSGGGASCDLVEPSPPADLSITQTDSPDPGAIDEPLVYTLTVTNNGPDSATGVTVTDPLLGGVTFVSATPSQGTCIGTSTVTCALGNLANGASATVTIVVTPSSAGALSNTASVTGSPSDPDPGDNSASSTTTINERAVVPPAQGSCNRTACGVQLTCTLGAPCADRRVTLFVPGRTVRLSEGALAKVPKRIKFAFGVANVPPSLTARVKLKLTKKGKDIVKRNGGKKLTGKLEIRNAARTPISTTRIRIRFR